jgi:hypothetical protein
MVGLPIGLPLLVPISLARRRPARTRSWIMARSNSAVCGALHTAEFQRELIRARTGEGHARAKAHGVHMGRPAALTPHQQAETRKRRDNGETLMDIARTYGVSHTTISRGGRFGGGFRERRGIVAAPSSYPRR